MAAFGISFPKITLCRSSASKPDANHVPSAPPSTTSTARTLSLSIKNIPSQPLHYDICTTTMKKKTPTFTTILAIDGETKQLPKTLSVFNELQLDEGAEEIDERRRAGNKSSDAIMSSSSSSSLVKIVDHRPQIQVLAHSEATMASPSSVAEERQSVEERKSNQTFTPPTPSLSDHSSLPNDLHSTLSSLSVDLPPLQYALEKFLVDGAVVNDPVYEIAEEFAAGCALSHQNSDDNSPASNITTPDLNSHQQQHTETIELHSMREERVQSETLSHLSPTSHSIKWYVSELRIHQPLVYRTQWTNKPASSNHRKLSHSTSDLTQIYAIEKPSEDGKYRIISRKTNDIAHSTLSLQHLPYQQPAWHRSDDNVLPNSYLSCTDDEDFHDLPSDEDNQRLSPVCIPRRLQRPLVRDDSLIRNESVKKKLFDILNDDELENACLEDMCDEIETISFTHTRQYDDLPMVNSFSSASSDDDDALYSSPPNELQFPPSLPLVSSSSYHENLSTSFNHTTEYYLGRSRLITSTSLEKISVTHNAYNHLSSSCTLRSSYESAPPSWYTSPLPQWRVDDPFPMPAALKRHSSRKDDYTHLNELDNAYDTKENKSVHKYAHHLNYPSTPIADDSTPVLPVIRDKSPNLLMFI